MSQPNVPQTAGPLLEVQDLKKWYAVRQGMLSSLVGRQSGAHVKAVDGVSFTLQKGEVLGLVGESGSGKSTLGELVVQLQAPTSGSIHYRGSDLKSLRGAAHKRFRRQVQVIFQDPYATLNPRWTIYQTVVEPVQISGVRDPHEAQERVRTALTRAGLRPTDGLLGSFPSQLSGGQRQRVAVARAIVLEPELVVADEPVSMLDVSIRSGLLNLLAELRRTMGLSIIFISHDLSTVQYLCDRVAIMYLGKIVEIGPTEQVMQRPHHPYARALLSAVPLADPEARRVRPQVQGEPSNSIDLPPGCRFAPRCPFMTTECNAAEPALDELGPAHYVRCIHPRFEPVWEEVTLEQPPELGLPANPPG
jgi:peptide/nickel transport system ATP-binding protein